MNDFTKDELLILLLEVEVCNINPTQKVQILINKLKYMIDNYCEHEETYEDLDSQPIRCKKCLEVVE